MVRQLHWPNAMRVLSRSEEKCGGAQDGAEADGLVRSAYDVDDAQNDASPTRISRVTHVAMQQPGFEEGAEIILDEAVFVDNDATTKNNDTCAHTKFNKRSGYRLRKILSTPIHREGNKKGSALRRTPSYEPKVYSDDHDDDDDTYNDSPLYIDTHALSAPIEVTHTLSFRRKRSEFSFEDENLSTVAESTDASSIASSQFGYGGNKDHRSRRKLILRRVVPAMFLLALALIAVAIFLIVGNSHQLEDNQSLEWDGGDVQVIIADDEAVDKASEDKAANELAEGKADEEEASRASEDDIAAPPGNASNPSSSTQTEPAEPATPSSITSVTSLGSSAVASSSPTAKPTISTYTKFYVMADCPYSDKERQKLMPKHIEGLSTDAEFLFHLGDLQNATKDKCEEWAYEEATSIIKKSPLPTFVLPGDNDINDCDDHEHGEKMWTKYYHKIDERWEHSFNLTRWGALDESFSFLHKGVLYFGLNIVGGSPYSKSEAKNRYKKHLEYIHWIIDESDDDAFHVMVLLAHAEPKDRHEDFFEGSDGFAAIVEELGKPTLHLHGDWHEYYEVEGDFGVDNYMRISLDGESLAPPIKVEIDVSKKNPVRVSRRRSDLDVDCCEDGWPRHDEL